MQTENRPEAVQSEEGLGQSSTEHMTSMQRAAWYNPQHWEKNYRADQEWSGEQVLTGVQLGISSGVLEHTESHGDGSVLKSMTF